MKRNNAISKEFVVLFIFIWSSIQISTNTCFAYQHYQVFNFCCVTEYSSDTTWLWIVPAKPEVLHKESGKLCGRASYLVHSRCPYSVVFETVVSNRGATPAGFMLTRTQNHNKVISASRVREKQNDWKQIFPHLQCSLSCCLLISSPAAPLGFPASQWSHRTSWRSRESLIIFRHPSGLTVAHGLSPVASRDPAPFRVPQHVHELQVSCLLCLCRPHPACLELLPDSHSQLSPFVGISLM